MKKQFCKCCGAYVDTTSHLFFELIKRPQNLSQLYDNIPKPKHVIRARLSELKNAKRLKKYDNGKYHIVK